MNDMTIRGIGYDSDEYQEELKLRNKVLRKPLGLDLFSEDLSQDALDVHIGAFRGNKLLGCLVLSKVNDTTLKMRQVAVDDGFRGMGIGTKMVAFAEKYAIQKGCMKITMHARKTAVDFYKKLGYEVNVEEFMEVLVPHYKMEKYIGFTSSLRMEQVTDSNLEQFASILAEAADWMISQGFRNWDPDSFGTADIKEKNNMDELFLCYMGKQPVGCIKLQETDEMFWPDAVCGESLYIHKLAVKRKHAGIGISDYMLNWAKEQVRLRGRKYLRLDCIADRKKLCGFYIGQGFEKVDERQVFGTSPSARFEYKV